MKVSIIIPVYNEERTVGRLLSAVKAASLKGLNIKKEIVVVDDGSTDRSGKILAKVGGIKLLEHKTNRGKGAAVRTGISNSGGGIIIIQDADLEYNPEEIPAVIGPIVNGNAKVVYGSRFRGEIRGHKIITHYLGNFLLSAITSLLYGSRITDMETGYKAFAREVVEDMQLEAEGFDIEPEITAKILKRGYKIKEVPITFSARGFDEGKKITWRDGFKALGTLIRYWWSG